MYAHNDNLFSPSVSPNTANRMGDSTMHKSLGAVYLGVVAASFLFGVTTLQVYIYYQHFPEDKLQNKLVVPFLWLMDALHLALSIHAVYFYIVNQAPFIHIVWYVATQPESLFYAVSQRVVFRSMRVQLSFVVVITFTVTSLYAMRIWNLAQNRSCYLVLLLVVAQLLEFAAGGLEAYTCIAIPTYLQIDDFLWQMQIAFAAHAVVDCFLAGGMCYCLQMERTSFSVMDGTVVRLMRYVVCSGGATSACAIATLIALAIDPGSQVWLAFYFVLSKLYVNSFLALLNARRSICRGMEQPSSPSALSDVRFAHVEPDAHASPQSAVPYTASNVDSNDNVCRSSMTLNGAPSRDGLAEGPKTET
ncbi:hypothetical protein PILCRDRAFT_6878 [Piloderma croceum F 1598]|uniref:DUF6534 domain-containing protein n=1 Tax=Piloderma croceum (strain F 1598) TaxID=765440 RepID=A0A0C3C379_PILCF|nr:hypothetical protein PILCRDRAFT_6878 [Piloderma croceum F 1598]